MKISVLFFAIYRDRIQRREMSFEFDDGSTVCDAIEAVNCAFPQVRGVEKHSRYALNEAFVPITTLLSDGDTLAMIPPVAGGCSDRFAVIESPLNLDVVRSFVSRDEAGAVVVFEGVVRNHSGGKSVVHLDYEAYPSMAVKILHEIEAETISQWPDIRVAVHHRVGHLSIGDVAVVIAVSAPHRKHAFLACEFTIDRLKEILPIWKKETTDDGTVWVGMGP